MAQQNNWPKLHNAMWPGVVGKGPDSEPFISLDAMLEMTAAAEVDDVKFDGVDLFLADPHISIDSSDNTLSGIASAINSAANNPGVTASVITTSAGARLVFTGSATGAANAITVTQAGGDGGRRRPHPDSRPLGATSGREMALGGPAIDRTYRASRVASSSL